jgi:hypothetical protein
MEKVGSNRGYRMTTIVVFGGDPLNAHSCLCLAHFSIGLEKSSEKVNNESLNSTGGRVGI